MGMGGKGRDAAVLTPTPDLLHFALSEKALQVMKLLKRFRLQLRQFLRRIHGNGGK